jgi:hypothetical protein
VSGSPFTINYRYTSDGTFASVSATSFLMVTPATLSVGVTAASGTAVFGQPVAFVATVTATGTTTGSVTFFDGAVPVGTVPLDGTGRATLTSSSLAVGAHSITASYGGDLNHLGATSGAISESVAQAGTQVVLVRHPVFKKKKVVSVRLTAEVEPLAPGQGMPSGTAKFMVKKKTLGTLVLGGGAATLTLKAGSVLQKAVTVIYSGDQDFRASQAATPVLTQALLRSLAQPTVNLVKRSSPFSFRTFRTPHHER